MYQVVRLSDGSVIADGFTSMEAARHYRVRTFGIRALAYSIEFGGF